LREEAARLSVEVTDAQAGAIEKYLQEVQKYNEHTNLVAKADSDVLVRDHVMDALSLVPILRKLGTDGPLVDIGSGAGFPAMVLAIMFDEMPVLLIDSVGKKTRFLEEAASALGLAKRVEVLNARAEEKSHDAKFRESFALATARAVGKLDLVAELTIPFLAKDGWLLAQKSQSQLEEELEPGRKAAFLLGAEVKEIEKLDSEVLGRDLVVVCAQKQKPTPRRFPRPTAQLKRPLD
jgi:16S rRNA (guanine527-N7)-methyltransferase